MVSRDRVFLRQKRSWIVPLIIVFIVSVYTFAYWRDSSRSSAAPLKKPARSGIEGGVRQVHDGGAGAVSAAHEVIVWKSKPRGMRVNPKGKAMVSGGDPQPPPGPAPEKSLLSPPAVAHEASSDYRQRQYAATPFPDSYVSALARAAKDLGVDTPDIYKRHRVDGGGFNECPPHDMDDQGNRRAATDLAKKAGSAFTVDKALAPPKADAVASLTLGLVVVSFDAPETLRATLESWREGGLLDLADDRVAFLNAARPEEIALAHAAGFRVYTPNAEEVGPLLARHRDWLSQFDHVPASKLFPATRNVDGRAATYVAPSQIMAYLEMATDIVIFAEKDYVLAPVPLEQTVRHLLGSIAMLQSGTNVVRLRRIDDENRDAIQDCCNTPVCGNSFNNFGGGTCAWESHLNWLAIFCDTPNIEARSHGRVKQCMAEAKGVVAGKASTEVEAMGAFCFSMDDSGWSNNVAMFARKWWVTALGHGAVLTEGDNGMFELNMVRICDYVPKNGLGAGADGHSSGRICQLEPGMFVHREKEVHINNGATRVDK